MTRITDGILTARYLRKGSPVHDRHDPEVMTLPAIFGRLGRKYQNSHELSACSDALPKPHPLPRVNRVHENNGIRDGTGATSQKSAARIHNASEMPQTGIRVFIRKSGIDD